MRTSSRFGASLSAAVFAAALVGCVQLNLLRSVELVPNQNPALGTPLAFELKGSGTCAGLRIDWGDGSTSDVDTAQTTSCHVDTDAAGAKSFRCYVEHTYKGWEGGKTVTAMARLGCEGRARTRFVTTPAAFVLALARPGPNACDAVPDKPALANPTIVRITTVPLDARCSGIFYQNVTPHCYDADGVAELATATGGSTNFPFLGMRKFSMVLKVGTQRVQGGTNVQFTTEQSAPLEVCVNEPNPQAGVGGYEIHIRANELGPPP